MYAQIVPNKWIYEQKKYWKIQIASKGVYRISFEEMQKKGLGLQLNPAYFQMFRRGEEVALLIENNNDTLFNRGDSFSFFALPNDGKEDTLLYQKNSHQPQIDYSLFTDTAAYFLVYSPEVLHPKRIVSASIVPNLAKIQEVHWDIHRQVFTDNYFVGLTEKGTFPNEEIYDSHYVEGEGWMSPTYGGTTPLTYNLPFTNAQTGQLHLSIGLVGQVLGKQWVIVSNTWNAERDSILLEDARPVVFNKTIAFKADNPNPVFAFTIQGTNTTSRYAISTIAWRYPQKLVLNEKEKYLNWPENNSLQQVLLESASSNWQYWDVSYQNRPELLTTSRLSANQIVLTTNATQIYAFETPKSVLSIKPVTFASIEKGADYLIITDSSLLQKSNAIADYAHYRASTAGGQFKSKILTTEQLYDLFSFGDKSIIALQRYLAWMKIPSQKQYVFLIGSSVYPHKARKSAAMYALDLVPNVGWPSSDTPLVMDSVGIMGMAIGRLAVTNTQEIEQYLAKVKEYENVESLGLWRKRFLHLSGGRYLSEQKLFKQNLDEIQQIAQLAQHGLYFSTIAKKTDDPVEFINTAQHVNQGLAMITLFGHSAIGQADLDIGYASNSALGYKNQGKYPFVLVNGCDAGDLFSGKIALGTDWITTPNKGAILFLAHTHTAYPAYLQGFSKMFYTHLFQDSLGLAIGDIHAKTLESLHLKTLNNAYWQSTLQQFTLQGDPAISLTKFWQKPDLAFAEHGIEITEEPDSLKITLIVNNYGKAPKTRWAIAVRCADDSKTLTTYRFEQHRVPFYSDTIILKIPKGITLAHHSLKMTVDLDIDNQLDEWQENNNTAFYEWTFRSPVVSIFSPENFGIVNHTKVLFKGFVAPIITDGISLQIDTLISYNSPFWQQQRLLAKGYFEQAVTLLPQDSLTYYWQIVDTQQKVLASGSFTYLSGTKEGWMHNTFEQLQYTNTDKNVVLQDRKWQQKPLKLTLSMRISGADVLQGNYVTSLVVNKLQYLGNGLCYPWNSVNAIAFDISLQPYSVIPTLSCGNSPYCINNLHESLLVNQNPMTMYLNAIKQKEWVLLFSRGRVDTQSWSSEVWQALQAFGISITQLKVLKSGCPFVILAQKGGMVAFEKYGTRTTDNLLVDNFTIEQAASTYMIKSPWIGSARQWYFLKNQIEYDSTQATWTAEIWGKTAEGNSQKLQEYPRASAIDLTSIQASRYPFLQICWKVTTFATAKVIPQLQKWAVYYQPLPEGILLENRSRKVFQELEPLHWQMQFKNISQQPFQDSISVKIVLQNTLGVPLKTQYKWLKSVLPNDSAWVNILIDNDLPLGYYWVSIVANPYSQPEQDYSNNTATFAFEIQPDQTPPVLSVKINERIVTNYEPILAHPQVDILLEDENPFRPLPRQAILFEEKHCRYCSWIPLQLGDSVQTRFSRFPNLLHWRYSPQSWVKDTIWIRVQGTDAQQNRAGVEPYQIAILIKNDTNTIKVNVWPNLLQAYSRFIISDITEKNTEGLIQIWDITGVLQTEWPIVLNRGLNEIIWDGKDRTGNLLLNGMYFYKVILQNKDTIWALRNKSVFAGKIFIFR